MTEMSLNVTFGKTSTRIEFRAINKVYSSVMCYTLHIYRAGVPVERVTKPSRVSTPCRVGGYK